MAARNLFGVPLAVASAALAAVFVLHHVGAVDAAGPLLFLLWAWTLVAVLYVSWGSAGAASRDGPKRAAGDVRGDAAWVGGAFVLALALRLLPMTRLLVPPGYDYGFYRVAMDHWADAAPAVPMTTQPDWMAAMFEPGLLMLHEVLAVVAGLSALEHLTYIVPIVGAALVLPLFVVVRCWWGSRAARVGALLYAGGLAPLAVHLFLYEKNLLAIWLLLGVLFLVGLRRVAPAMILAAATAAFHRPTALVGALVLAVAFAVDAVRRRSVRAWLVPAGIAAAALLVGALVLPTSFWHAGLEALQSGSATLGRGGDRGAGTFLEFPFYQVAAALYLAAAVAALVVAMRLRRGFVLTVPFVLLFANVALSFLFYRRFIIFLDLFALLLAPLFLVRVAPRRRVLAVLALTALVAANALPALALVAELPRPPIQNLSNQQIEGIREAAALTPPEAVLLASNQAAPYVAAESGRTTFGQRLFGDMHTAGQWERFATGQDDNESLRFLQSFGTEVYLLEFDAPGGDYVLRFKPYAEPAFSKIYDDHGVRMWRTNPRSGAAS